MTACFRAPLDRYDGVRRLRVESLVKVVEPVWGVEVGDNRFLDLLKTESFDLFCHHAAEVANYRSWEFDALGATAKNTRAARRILRSLAGKDCQRMIMTGSVFEPFEGEGDPERRALNPYGLSKHLSFEVYRLETQRVDVALDKFVIPNPFGPLEEPRASLHILPKSGRRVNTALGQDARFLWSWWSKRILPSRWSVSTVARRKTIIRSGTPPASGMRRSNIGTV